MDVVGDAAGVHERIHTGDTGLGLTRHAPEGVGATHESEGGGGGAPDHCWRRRIELSRSRFGLWISDLTSLAGSGAREVYSPE